MNKKPEKIAIVGAGPVGSLLAVMLAKQGYNIDLFESRSDSRKTNVYQGKSINLALSDRGWMALESVGIADSIKEHAIPMYSRVMHDKQGKLTTLPYGNNDQAIWSVSRSGINEQLLTLAEQEPNIAIHFNHHLTRIDFNNLHCEYQHQKLTVQHQSDLLIAADGAFSKVRRSAQELSSHRISYSLAYMPQSYIELTIPAKYGEFQLEKNALHIWPRKHFMLIALPNPDGSFTCTLFMNDEGPMSFAELNNKDKVSAFFQENFADALPLLENPIEQFLAKTPAPLCLVHIYPWVINDKVALIGDAAHAMVPFYGQGMNCGFEDCRIFNELVGTHNDWPAILNNFQQQRKPNADAITELAKRNFVEMSDLSGDERFLLRKKIEAKFNTLHPELWIPLYSMVTFSPNISYATALKVGDIQQQIMEQIMALPNITKRWQDDDVYELLYQLAREKLESTS